METENKQEFQKLWEDFFGRVYEATSCCALLFSSALSKSRMYLDETLAAQNVLIHNKYIYFFSAVERAAQYSAVLSIAQLFEDGQTIKKSTLAYLANEASKVKIDCKSDLKGLQGKHAATLQQVKSVRDNYFAHRAKGVDKNDVTVPSRDKIFALLNDIAQFLNSIGKKLGTGGHSFMFDYSGGSGFTNEVDRDFKRVLEDLKRVQNTPLEE